MTRYKPLDKLVSDFSEGRQGTTVLALLGIASLVHKGREEFGLKDIYDAITGILSKFKEKPAGIGEIVLMSLLNPLSRLCDMGVIEKVSDKPTTYGVTIDKETMYRYAGELMLTLLEKILVF